MKRITFTADDELADELAREARSRRKTVSEVIRDRLRGADEEPLPRRFAFIGMGRSDGKWSAAQLDEFLDATWADEIMKHRGK